MREGQGYGTGTRVFHWATTGLVAVMIPAGVLMTSDGFEGIRDALFIIHKGTGSFLLLIVSLRVLWKLLVRDSPGAPAGMSALQWRMASWAHWGLYALLLIMVVSGYVRTVGDGYPIEVLDALGVPPLLPEMPEVARAFAVVHKATAFALTALISVHVGAVVHQTLVVGDGTLRRMWPPRRPGRDD